MIMTDPSKPAEDPVDESPDDSCVDGPSLEEVIERVKRVRPQPLTQLQQTAPELAGHSIGRYTIRRIAGRGAFGVVYQAYDEQLGRDVALKLPRPEVLFDEEKLHRFESEAATAATLEHPSIIPIYEADLTGPTPYIASAYCAGPDLGEWLGNLGTSVPVEQAARFVIKLAEAVHYAHRQGVLHRDLKPSNVMLEPCPKNGLGKNQLEHFEPKLTDFGLAKLLESDREDTRSSMLLGTPRYMAPEQFDKRLGNVGISSDVYALGAILYELLLGLPAVEGSSHGELLMAILEREVTPPSHIRSSIKPTLEAICLKALEKRPKSRYSTATELADDLGRYLRGEPTQAKPLSLAGRAIKWIGHNSLAASLCGVVLVSLVCLVVGVLWHNGRLSEQLAVSDRLRIESVESADRFLRANYVSDMQLTQQAMAKGRYAEARSRLDKYQANSDGAKVSDFAWHLLSDQLKRAIVEYDYRGPLMALATSDVLGVSTTGGKDGMLRFFDTATGKQVALTQAHDGNINALAFAADGTTLVSGGDDGYLRVWDTSLMREHGDVGLVVKQKAHDSDLLCLAIAVDGKLLASGSADHKVRFWEFNNLEPAGELTGHTDWVRSLDFSPDGKMLVSASDDATIRRWDPETQKEVDQFIGHDKYVLSIKHHPTEPLLVSGGTDRTIRFWDLTTGKERQQLSVLNGWVRSLRFSEDGNRIAVAGEDPRVMLLQRKDSGQYEQTKAAFTDRNGNQAVSFAKSDCQIVSVGSVGASAWSFDDSLRGEKLHVARGWPSQMVSLSKDNSVAVVTSNRLLTADFGTDSIRVVGLLRWGEVAISSAGNLIAACEYEDAEDEEYPRVFVTDGKGENKKVLFSGFGESRGIDVSPSGKYVVAATPDRIIRIWQAPDFQEKIVRTPFESDFDGFLIDETGKWLYLQPKNIREMTILDVATSEPMAKFSNVESLLNRSAEGRYLAISKTDYSVDIYDTQLGTTIQSLPSHPNAVVGGCFSPIEPLMATITNAGEITLWALDTSEILIKFQAAFRQPPMLEACLGFTSEGRTLVAAGGYFGKGKCHLSEIRVWRVGTGDAR
jgi:WD40 repeat protein/serine/threonine protein kinase